MLFAVPKDCTVRVHIFSCREQDCRGRISRSEEDVGGLYMLRILLKLGFQRNGQEKIKKCERFLETNQRL